MFLSALLTATVALAPASGEATSPSAGDANVDATAEPEAKPNAQPETKPEAKPSAKDEAQPAKPNGTAEDGAKPAAPNASLMRPFDAVVVPAAGPIVTETCEAVRTPSRTPPESLSCTGWRIEWTHKGKVWGSLHAASLAELQQKKARHLAFERQYARAFDLPKDVRYDEASPNVCDQCDPAIARGRWGEGQTFSGLQSARALQDANEMLSEFERVFYDTHAPEVAEVARLAGERKSAAAAKRYAQQLSLAAAELAAWQAQLDQAELLRSEDKVGKVIAAMKARGTALDKGLDALGKQVASEVAKAHAGVYAQEGAAPASTPTLTVAVDGRKVTATFGLGKASSVWFEGTVALDGSIRGRSLMAPPGVKLSCQEHAEACGYEYIPSMIRFSVRPEPRKEVLELWFQRDTWVAATPFSRD